MRASPMNHPLRALRHRNFRLFMLGQGAGILGYWIQQIALNWLVYRLTGSALLLGVTTLASQLPILVLGPLAGAFADRIDLYRAFVFVQVLQLAQAVAMVALAWLGVIEPWHMIALAAFLGATIAFELPLRHAYLPSLLDDREDLSNAVAVTSMVAAAGRLIGPAVAGLAIARFGETVCFALNALSFLVVLVTLACVSARPGPRPAGSRAVLADLTEGARYAWRSLPIRVLLIVLALMSFMATPYVPLMPAFVREAFQGGPETLGLLVGSAGLGALAGTLYLSMRGGTRGLARVIVAAVGCAGVALVAFSFSRSLPLSVALMVLTGFGILATSVSVSMTIQALVEDGLRGRVMSLYTVAFLGVAPLGGLVAGALADAIGASATLAIGGACCATAALVLARLYPGLVRALPA